MVVRLFFVFCFLVIAGIVDNCSIQFLIIGCKHKIGDT